MDELTRPARDARRVRAPVAIVWVPQVLATLVALAHPAVAERYRAREGLAVLVGA